jgi:predicted nucleic acid-binding protein
LITSILPALFERVIIPMTVRDELGRPGAPASVQLWIANPPAWTDVKQSSLSDPTASSALDPGEVEAIALAIENSGRHDPHG